LHTSHNLFKIEASESLIGGLKIDCDISQIQSNLIVNLVMNFFNPPA
jgi:hypothetical protein